MSAYSTRVGVTLAALALVACTGPAVTQAPSPRVSATPPPATTAAATPAIPIGTVTSTAAPTAPSTVTAEPTAAETAAPTTGPIAAWIGALMTALGLAAEIDVPIEADLQGDGLRADGGPPRDISSDLDVVQALAFWAELDPSLFDEGGAFACGPPVVMCSDDPQPVPGETFLLAFVRTAAAIELRTDRVGQIAIALDAPSLGESTVVGGYDQAERAFVVDLPENRVVAIEWQETGFASVPTGARVMITGDTAVFAIPTAPDETSRYRVVTFEQFPLGDANQNRIDVSPEIGAFFDILAEGLLSPEP